jgi:hypothetical protein
MKALKISVVLVMLGIVASIAFETNTQAASNSTNPIVTIGNVPLPVTDTNAGKYTHLGQKVGQLVVLRFANNEPASRIDLATGSEQSTPFEVPANFVFVLTDIHGNAVCTPGQPVGYLLFQKTPNNVNSVLRDRNWTVCNAVGDTGIVRHLNTGMPFSAGARIETALSPTVDNFLWAEGYLVPAN